MEQTGPSFYILSGAEVIPRIRGSSVLKSSAHASPETAGVGSDAWAYCRSLDNWVAVKELKFRYLNGSLMYIDSN